MGLFDQKDTLNLDHKGIQDDLAELNNDFAARPAEPAAPSSMLRRTIADPALGFVRGVAKLPNVAVGLADIATGGKAGKVIEDATGYDFSAADDFYNPLLTPETRAAQQKVSQTFRDQGFIAGLGSAVANPSTIAQTVAESLPAMGAGGGLARLGIAGLGKLAPAVASRLAPVAVGAGEGAVTAGQIAEDIRTQSPDRELTGKQAALSSIAGLATMGIGAAGSKLANSALGRKLGLADIDSVVAGIVRESAEGPTPNAFKRAAAGVIQEGLLEELPQSMQEQALQNIAQGKDWREGLAESAGMGLLSGGLMGAGSSAALGGRDSVAQPLAAPTEPLPSSANITEQAGDIPEFAPPAAPPASSAAGTSILDDSNPQPVPAPTGAISKALAIAGVPVTNNPYAAFAANPFAGAPAQGIDVAGPRVTSLLAGIDQGAGNAAGNILPQVPAPQGQGALDGPGMGVPLVPAEVQGGGSGDILSGPGGIAGDSIDGGGDTNGTEGQTGTAEGRQKGRQGLLSDAGIAGVVADRRFARGGQSTMPANSGLKPVTVPSVPASQFKAGDEVVTPSGDRTTIESINAPSQGGHWVSAINAAGVRTIQHTKNLKPAPASDKVIAGVAAETPQTLLDVQAHDAATSPHNDTPEPTQAQIEAGNYKKGHVNVHGLDISIENPAGSMRKGVDENGKAWETRLAHHYGYIKGTVGKDKDHVDVFVGPQPESAKVFVVDQKNTKTGKLDEHKVMLGFDSLEAARKGYLANYDKSGPSRIMAVTETTVDGFKQWLDKGSQDKPFASHALTAKTVGSQKPGNVNDNTPAPGAGPIKLNYLVLNKQAREAGYKLGGKQKDGSYQITRDGQTVATVKGLEGISDFLTGREKDITGRENVPAAKQSASILDEIDSLSLDDISFMLDEVEKEQTVKRSPGAAKKHQAFLLRSLRNARSEKYKAQVRAAMAKVRTRAAVPVLELTPEKDGEIDPRGFLYRKLVAIGESGRIRLEDGNVYTMEMDDAVKEDFVQDVEGYGFTINDISGVSADGERVQVQLVYEPERWAALPKSPTAKLTEAQRYPFGKYGSAPGFADYSKVVRDKVLEDNVLAGKPAKDDGKEPYFKEGDRIETEEGRHGTILKASTYSMTSTIIDAGGVRSGGTRWDHMYDVRWDNGVVGYGSFNQMLNEKTPAPAVVPAPFYDKAHVEPDALLRNIEYSRTQAINNRAAAGRARKPTTIDSLKKAAVAADKRADEQQAVFDAWAEKYPEEAALFLPEKKKPVSSTTATAAPAAEVKPGSMPGLRVTLNAAREGIELHFNGKPAEEILAKVKANGFRWARGSRLWYASDTPARRRIVEGWLGHAVEDAPQAAEYQLKDNEVQPEGSPYVYRKTGDQWAWAVKGTKTGDLIFNAATPAMDLLNKLETMLAQKSYQSPISAPPATATPGEKGFDSLAQEIQAVRLLGKSAHLAGDRRLAPDGLTKAFKAEWYHGWDAGNLAASDNEIDRADVAPDWWKAYTEAGQREILKKLGIGYKLWHYFTAAEKTRIADHEDGTSTQVTKVEHISDGGGVFGSGPISKAIEQADIDHRKEQERDAGAIIKAAAAEGVKGAESALKGLHALFGGSSLKTFPGAVDEATYAAARPHFKAALDHFVAAGKGLKEYLEFLFKQFGGGIKPYALRFLSDVKNNAPELQIDGIIQSEAQEGVDSHVINSAAEEDDRNGPDGQSAADVPGSAAEREDGAVSDDAAGTDAGDLPGGIRQAEGADTDGSQGPDGDGTGLDNGKKRGHGKRDAGGAGVRGTDYRIPAGGLKREGSWRATAERNLDIIALVRRLDAEGRPATQAEQELLSKYTGFGASEIANKLFPGYAQHGRIYEQWADKDWRPLVDKLLALELSPEELKTLARSTQYAHYTSEGIVRGIYAALESRGFKGGKILEPGMGSGNFIGAMPDSVYGASKYTGIEMDHLTASIAKYLYPQQNILQADYTKQKLPRDFFDLAIGNPPFADIQILTDPEYKKSKFSLHDYFFAKTIDRVRPGGLMVFVTSRYTMDKVDDKARAYLSERADLVGAVRLPQTAFLQQSGTETVTDILFLRKKQADVESEGFVWGNLKEVMTADGAVKINEYFVDHPEMVLGDHAFESSQHGPKYTVVPKNGDFDEQFTSALENLPGYIYSQATQPAAKQREAVAERDFNPKIRKEGGIYLNDDGVLMRVENGAGQQLDTMVKLSKRDREFLADYVPLRDAVKQAKFDQWQDEGWEKSLKQANKLYQAFVKKHGRLQEFTTVDKTEQDEDGNDVKTSTRRFKNSRLFQMDTEGVIVEALESINDDGVIKESAFLRERTIRKPEPPKVETLTDALAVSLDQTGAFDLDHVAGIANLPRQELIEGLGDMIYETTAGEWQLADEYLSGNVVRKLEEAEQAARMDSRFQRNVEALAKVQPKPLTNRDISVKLGATWLDHGVIEEFAETVLEAPMSITYTPATGKWRVENGAPRKREGWYYGRRGAPKAARPQGLRGAGEWSTQDRGANELLEAILNNQSIKITRTEREPGGGTKTYTDTDATTAANEKATAIRKRFSAWVWEDAERANILLDEYNKRYNNIAPRRFDGSHLTLPGVSLKYKLHPHQLRAIWRVIQTGDTYLAHAVGAGKTIEMIAAGMEMKRLGMVSKPLYVVPNHMLEQFGSEFQDLYPLASVMVADFSNFDTKQRKRFVAQASMNNPDAVIITHDTLKNLLGMKPENVAEVRDEILDELREHLYELQEQEGEKAPKTKQMEKRIENAEQRFDSIAIAENNDSLISFEDLGIDFMFVDEAHNFRKLDFTTSRQVKGIDPIGSKAALKLYIVTRWLNKRQPGRSMVFASGTPITNTIGELFTVQRFFQHAQLEEDGINHFDAWSAMFGEIEPGFEMNAAGRYEVVERFSKFDNMPELSKRVRSFMDVLTSDQLSAYVKRPDIRGGQPEIIVVPPSAELKEYQQNVLMPRIERSKKWKPSREQRFNPDPIIAIIADGRLASIDMRFVDNALKSDPDSKLNRMIDGIIESYKEGKGISFLDRETGKPDPIKGAAQIVFYNQGFGAGVVKNRGFDSRAWLMKRLRDAKIPASEVAWIDDYDSADKKEAMMKEVRQGNKRILIGSAKKMGTGMNVQKRLGALHYLDPPWYPADVIQPDGRILRQGNQNEVVEMKRYATKGSYDATQWQMVARKAKAIESFLNGDDSVRSIEDLSESNQFAMAAALASGDERVIQLAGLQADVERMTSLQRNHFEEQASMRYKRSSMESGVKWTKGRIADLKEASKVVGGYVREFTGKIGGKEYTNREEFGQALLDEWTKMAEEFIEETPKKSGGRKVGTLNGFPISLLYQVVESHTGKGKEKDYFLDSARFHLEITKAVEGNVARTKFDSLEFDEFPRGLVDKIINTLNGVDKEIRDKEQSLQEDQEQLAAIEKRLGTPFPYANELAEKVAEATRLQNELTAEGEVVPDAGTLPAIDFVNDGDEETANFALTGAGGFDFSPAARRKAWDSAEKLSERTRDDAVSFLSRRDAMFKARGLQVESYVEPEHDRPGSLALTSVISKDGRPMMVLNRKVMDGVLHLDKMEKLVPEDEKTGLSHAIYRIEADVAQDYFDKVWGIFTNEYKITTNLFEKYYGGGMLEGDDPESNYRYADYAAFRKQPPLSDTYLVSKFVPAKTEVLFNGIDKIPYHVRKQEALARDAESDSRQGYFGLSGKESDRRPGNAPLSDGRGDQPLRGRRNQLDTSGGVPVAQANAWVSTLPIARHVAVWQHPDQLRSGNPSAYRQIQRAGVNPDDIQAMEFGGELFVFAGKIPDMQRVKALVIGHELAHAGQTDKIVDFAVDWFRRTSNGKTEQARAAHAKLAEVAQRYGYDLDNEKQFRRAVKEATAAYAEQAAEGKLPMAGLMQRLFMYIKHWLRQKGLISHVSDKELSLAVAEMLRLGEKRLSTGPKGGGKEAMFAAAWHGSPHDHNRFSTEYVGEGEGNQAYGWGLYFAGAKEVAEFYRETLSRGNALSREELEKYFKPGNIVPSYGGQDKVISFNPGDDEHGWTVTVHHVDRNGERVNGPEGRNRTHYTMPSAKDYEKVVGEKPQLGRIYQVELAPEDDEYLLWDKPLSEQSEKVKVALQSAFDEIVNNETDYHKSSELSRRYADYTQSNDVEGLQAYNLISKLIAENETIENRQKAASEYLHSLGIRGIKYLDGTSRDKGDGNYNYVIFNDADVEITAKFALQDQAIAIKAAAIDAPGKVSGMVKSLFELAGQSVPERLKANIGKVLSNPWFGSEGKPIRRRVVELNLDRSHNRNGIISDLFQASEGYTGVEGLDNMLKAATPAERKQFNDLIKYGDRNDVGRIFTRDELYRGKIPEIGKVGKTVVEAYKAFHEIMAAANRVRFQQLDELSLLPYKEQEWFDDLVSLLNRNQERMAALSPDEAGQFNRLVRSLKRDLTDKQLATGENPAKVQASPAVIAAYRDFWAQVDGVERKHQGNLLSAFRDILGYRGEIDKLKNEWGSLHGYAPRNRKDGDWHVSVYYTDAEGERVKAYMRPTLTEASARRHVADVQKDLRKHLKSNFVEGREYEVEYERNTATPTELMAWKGSEVAVEALLNQAFDRAGVTGKMSVEQWQSLKHEVFQEIAKQIMAQGFGRHGIQREATLIEGYDDTDYQTVLKEYISGLAGWLSKMRFAIETTSAAKEISKADPGDKVWLNDYVQDAMKNSTYMDELAATARSLGAVYYLGFKVSSAILNAFQNYTVGQAELSLVMRRAGSKDSAIAALARAQKDVLRDFADRKRGGHGVLSAEETDVLHRAVREGTAQAQATRMISGSQEMGFGTKWKKFTELSMTPFQFVEQRLNREPGILAAYRALKKTPAGEFDAAAYKQAVEFVNNTHYVMGRENLPQMVRNLGPLGKTAYLFQGYVHNYLHWLYNRGRDGEFGTIARSLGAIAALGGVFALPGADDLDKWLLKWFGRSYKADFQRFVHTHAGDSLPGRMVERFVNHGITSVGGVDMSRALAVNIPFVSDPERTFGERVGGAWGGLLQKPGLAMAAAQKGDYYRALENMLPEFAANPMRAARQYSRGATTLSGRPIFDENGRQAEYSGGDVARKMLGFNPLEVSDRNTMKSRERDLNAHWKSERDDALAGVRRAVPGPDMVQAMRRVYAYNKALRESQAAGLVPPITMDSIQRSRSHKPQKKTMAWERKQP